MEKIQKNTVVNIQFSLRTSTGVLVNSEDNFSYLHGYGGILPGMETVLEGQSKGDTVQTELSPEDAFGVHMEHEPIQVHRQDCGKDFDRLHEGMGFPIQNSKGESVLIYVKKKTGSFVILSRNHPLAGETITFHANILDVRCASSDEVAKKMVLDHPKPSGGGSCSCC